MEEVTDQIDRLNFALQQVMDGMANVSFERPVRMSITSADWLENVSNDSLDLPENYEHQVESLIQELDRTGMLVEDLWSGQARQYIRLSLNRSEIQELVLKLQHLQRGEQCTVHLGKEIFNLTLDSRDEGQMRDVTLIENSIMDCGHDIIKIKKEIAMDVEIKLKAKKNQLIEEAKKNYENLFEEIEKIKSTYEEKLKDVIVYSNQLEKKEKNLELKELKMKKTLNSGEPAEDLEEKIKELQNFVENCEYDDQSRIALQIEQMKNKITNLRVEKVINESKQTTSVLSRITRAMEKEVSHDEKQRKKQLERLHQTHNRVPSDVDRPSLQSLKKQEENFKIYMEKIRSRIKKKEAELVEKEKAAEEKWSKVTGSKEFLDLLKQSIDKINGLREENDKEREVLEREKLDIVNWNEKIKRVWAGMESYRKFRNSQETEVIKEQIKELSSVPKVLGFN